MPIPNPGMPRPGGAFPGGGGGIWALVSRLKMTVIIKMLTKYFNFMLMYYDAQNPQGFLLVCINQLLIY